MFKVIIDNQENYPLGILAYVGLYFYFSSFNLVRQWIAIVICLYSIKYIKEKRLLPFLLLVCLATSIHLGAIIFLPVYFLAQMQINKVYRVLIIIISFFCFKIFNLWGLILRIMKYIFPLYYERYMLLDNQKANGYAYFTISIILILMYCIYESKLKEHFKEREYHIRFNLLTFTAIASLLSMVSFSASRLSFFFTPLLAVFLPDILLVFKNENIKKIVWILLVIGLFAYQIKLLLANIHHVLPYQIYW